MLRAVGIDLGTTKAVIATLCRGEPLALPGSDGSPAIPAVVGRSPQGRLVIGRVAASPAAEPVQDGALCAPGGEPYTPMERMALFLAQLKQQAERALGEPVRRAVLAIPTYFGQAQIASLVEAAHLAGLFVLRLVHSPMAAALAYSHGRPGARPQTVLVFDLGGGCLDVAVVRLFPGAVVPLALAGDGWLGGNEFSDAIVAHLIRQLQAQREAVPDENAAARQKLRRALRVHAERAKVALSVLEQAPIRIRGEVPGLAGEVGQVLTRACFEGLIGPRAEDALSVAGEAVEASGVPPEGIDGILLVGGASQVPLIEALLAARFPRAALLRGLNPHLSVAQGAAILAGALERVECPSCGHANPLDRQACERCGTALVGEERVLCPGCDLPNDGRRQACWKCGASLRGPAAGRHEAARCRACGASVRSGAASCPACFRPLSKGDPGGPRCPTCDRAAPAGATSCPACGALLAPFVGGMARHSLGLAFPDGRMDVLLPRGQILPSPRPALREVRTLAAGQAGLEVPVYEGERPWARENTGGRLRLHLPEGLPAGTVVQLAFALDRDGRLRVGASIAEGSPGDVEATVDWPG
ncbi:MAG: Hsp70 family protein [Anaerolineae bacterium]|nr:Hsp70 family protein [Anaerolineae bacterium]